jgi:hypothetical protein
VDHLHRRVIEIPWDAEEKIERNVHEFVR